MTPHDLLAAFEILTDAPDGIARMRELVLQLAVRGKLVPQDPNDEPAGVLLERITAEKARLVKAGKISKPKPLPPVGEDEAPFEVPEGWVWCRAEHLFELVTSGSRDWAKFYSKDGPIFLRIGNLDYGTTCLDLSNIQHVQPPANSEGTRTRTMPGDILVSITGDIGMVGVIPDKIGEAYINQHIAMCRPMTDTWPPYIATAFTSPPLLDQLRGYQRGIKNSLGPDDIRILHFPLPPLPEQNRIVAKVDALMALCNTLETNLANARKAQAAFAAAAVHYLDV
jgi:type I restriction enzyme, S subunit